MRFSSDDGPLIEEMLASRGVVVSYETIRQWCLKLAATFVKILKKKQGHLGDQWFLDDVFSDVYKYSWPILPNTPHSVGNTTRLHDL